MRLYPHFCSLAGPVHVKEHRPDDNDAREESLEMRRQVQGWQAGSKHRHDEHADDRAPDRSDAARKGGAADDRRRNGIQLEPLPLGGRTVV